MGEAVLQAENHQLREALAASQRENQELRERLKEIVSNWREYAEGNWISGDVYRGCANVLDAALTPAADGAASGEMG